MDTDIEIDRVKRAGLRLRATLANPQSVGVGVGRHRDGNHTIAIRVETDADAAVVPTEWEGLKVECIVTGPVVAL